MELEIKNQLNQYAAKLSTQLQEVEAILAKPTKASARRIRTNSLDLDKTGKVLRKLTIQEIG
jgi:hypothetical protein